MSGRIFPTAQDAENAFYEALERCDLDGMMAVWAEDEEIICVHPTGPRLSGPEQIRESWARVFSGGPRARIHITSQVAISGMMLAVHSVHENFVLPGQAQADARPVPTIATALAPGPRVTLARRRWETPDGDFIDIDFAGDPQLPRLAVLLHGLEGCSNSHYARRLAQRLPAAGWRVAIAHWRGCSGEPNRKPRAYHSGDSEEIDWILRRLEGELYAAGISLGGNALLKWLGERGPEAKRFVRRAAAISAPIDLSAAGHALDRGLNRL